MQRSYIKYTKQYTRIPTMNKQKETSQGTVSNIDIKVVKHINCCHNLFVSLYLSTGQTE